MKARNLDIKRLPGCGDPRRGRPRLEPMSKALIERVRESMGVKRTRDLRLAAPGHELADRSRFPVAIHRTRGER